MDFYEFVIEIDRRKGATICPVRQEAGIFREKLAAELELLSAEACLKGMGKDEFLRICESMFESMSPENYCPAESGGAL